MVESHCRRCAVRVVVGRLAATVRAVRTRGSWTVRSCGGGRGSGAQAGATQVGVGEGVVAAAQAGGGALRLLVGSSSGGRGVMKGAEGTTQRAKREPILDAFKALKCYLLSHPW